MAYTIIGSVRSPFVRACRLLMIQNSIAHDFRILNFVQDKNDAIALSKETPINKVPILIDGEQKIFDSRVIANHLIKKHGLRALTMDEENILSCIYSCLDSGVILFLMREEGMDIENNGFFVSRVRARIPANLKYIEKWVTNLDPRKKDDWNYASMALYSFLFWAQARKLIALEAYPSYATFFEKFKDSDGLSDTGF